MIKADLAAAGVPYKDAHDRYADFHALRHTFISNLARAGVHPRNAQALARHSTIDPPSPKLRRAGLTTRAPKPWRRRMNVYTHVAIDDLEAMAPVLVESAVKPEEQPISDPASPVPAELAALASNWAELPEHVRQAIAALAQS